MVFFKLGMSSSLGKKEGGIYTPSKNLTVGYQKVWLKPELSPAIAGLHTG
jgi:hypothetical protein